MVENMFRVPEDIQNRLNINVSRSTRIDDEILEIFDRAEREFGKKKLNIDEITAAYYNLFTLGQGKPEKNKKAITNRLFLMKGGTDDNGVLEALGKGVFRIRPSKEDVSNEK